MAKSYKRRFKSACIKLLTYFIVAETLAASSESGGEALSVVEPFFDQQSETVDLDRLYRLGIQLTPQVTQKFRGKVIFSIDWHQVLDCI